MDCISLIACSVCFWCSFKLYEEIKLLKPNVSQSTVLILILLTVAACASAMLICFLAILDRIERIKMKEKENRKIESILKSNSGRRNSSGINSENTENEHINQFSSIIRQDTNIERQQQQQDTRKKFTVKESHIQIGGGKNLPTYSDLGKN